MKTLATITSLSWITAMFAQATPATSPWEYGKDISFAGLVWFLVGYLIPRLLQSAKEDRNSAMASIEKLAHEHSEAVRAITATSKESSRNGHEAAAALAQEIRSFKEFITK